MHGINIKKAKIHTNEIDVNKWITQKITYF